MLLNRDSLKQLFSKGKFPTENHFAHLIDSTVNRMEDGLGKSADDGLQLAPRGEAGQVLSVYERMDKPLPDWQIKLLKTSGARGLSFDKVGTDVDNEPSSKSRLFMSDEGNIGVGTTAPRLPLHVAATVGTQARVGTRAYGLVPGDGEWHDILPGLTGVQAFEVVARIDGPVGRGKYAITTATAVSAFGGKSARNRIRQTRAYYGWFWNRIELRWHGELYNYALQVRTRNHYGFDDAGNLSFIKFHVTDLQDQRLFDGLTYQAPSTTPPAPTTQPA